MTKRIGMLAVAITVAPGLFAGSHAASAAAPPATSPKTPASTPAAPDPASSPAATSQPAGVGQLGWANNENAAAGLIPAANPELMQQLLKSLGGSGGAHPSLNLDPQDWSGIYRPQGGAGGLSLDGGPQVTLPANGTVSGANVGITFLSNKAGFTPTGDGLDYSLMGLNVSGKVAKGVSISTGMYTSAGKPGEFAQFAQGGPNSGGSSGMAEKGTGGAALSEGMSLDLSHTHISGLWTNVGKDFTTGSISADQLAQTPDIKNLAAEHGGTRLKYGIGYDLSKTGGLNLNSDHFTSAGGLNFGSDKFAMNLGGARSLGFSRFTAKDTGGAASGSSLSLGLGHFSFATSDLKIGQSFTNFKQSQIPELAAHANEAGMARHTLDMKFAPGAHESMAFSRSQVSDQQDGINRQNLAVQFGGFSLQSESQSVGGHFTDFAHLTDPTEKLVASRERGLAQSAFLTKYAAGKNLALSLSQDSVRDDGGTLQRSAASVHLSMLDLNVRQASVAPDFHSSAYLADPGIAALAATPGLSEQSADLSIHPGGKLSLGFSRIDAADPRGRLASSYFSLQDGPGLLLEAGSRTISPGFKTFNKALGLTPLASEVGSQRDDFHLRVGQMKSNFIDASYTSMASLAPGGLSINGLTLAQDPNIKAEMDPWATAGTIIAPTPGVAAPETPAVAPKSTPVTPDPALTALSAPTGHLTRESFNFGLAPSRSTKLQAGFLTLSNGLSLKGASQSAHGLNFSLTQALGKDSDLSLVHNSIAVAAGPSTQERFGGDTMNLKLNQGALHFTADYDQQRPLDKKNFGKSDFVLADGNLHLDSHFAEALDSSGIMRQVHTGDIEYAMSRSFTLHLANGDATTHFLVDSSSSAVLSPAAPAGAKDPNAPPLAPFGASAMALQHAVGGGAMALVMFGGMDPNHVGIGGNQLSYTTNPAPNLPMHVQAAFNMVKGPKGLMPARHFQFAYQPVKKVTVSTMMDQNRLLTNGKVADGNRQQYVIEAPLVSMAFESETDPVSHRFETGHSIQFHDAFSKSLSLKTTLSQHPEIATTGSLDNSNLMQTEATAGPVTAFYRSMDPANGPTVVTRGINGKWTLAKSLQFTLGIADNALDAKQIPILGESQNWGLQGKLTRDLTVDMNYNTGVYDPITHRHERFAHFSLTGALGNLGKISVAYQNALTTTEAAGVFGPQLAQIGLDPSTMLSQYHGEIRGDIYYLQYAFNPGKSLSLAVDGGIIQQDNSAFNLPDTSAANLKVSLQATF
ncbi:MAG TPA: hypothetical protein VFJ58_22515 [Armatimonadota bacterium]|nr:hypothetical protein [Armatimonadota bacterium]